VIRCPGEPCLPTDWSLDGFLLVNAGADVWRVPLGEGTAQPLLTGPSVEMNARITADGAWVSYVSHESGRAQVFIRSLSGRPRRMLVSAGGINRMAA
jgi:Tol biopolymer transport system component